MIVFVARSVARERIGFGDVDRDDSSSKEPQSLQPLPAADRRLSVHLPNRWYRKTANVVTVSVSEWCPLSR